MELYVIRRPSAWANLQELQAAGAKSAQIGNEQMSDRVRWIRSSVVQEADGRSVAGRIAVKADPLDERAGAVADPDDGDSDFPHFSFGSRRLPHLPAGSKT